MRTCAVIAALAALLAPVAGAEELLRAERIQESTAAELDLGGPDASGGVGDWYLSNDRVEIVVDDPSRAYGAVNHGGGILDAGLRGRRGADQLARITPLVNLSQRVFVEYRSVRAEVDPAGAWARLVVSNDGRLDALPRCSWLDWLVPEAERLRDVWVETEYTVLPGEPLIRITTTIRNEGERAAPLFAYGDLWMRGGRANRAFSVDTLQPGRSRGYQHVAFDRRNLFRSDPLQSFTVLAVPGVRGFPPVGYGLFAPERAAAGLPLYGVTGEHVSLVAGLIGDPPWPELTALRLARATLRTLEPGASWSFARRLLITDRADAASITDQAFPQLGFGDGSSGLEGRVEPSGEPCVVLVEQAGSGAPITQVEARRSGPEAGRYRALLPPGRYVLRLRSPQRPERRLEVEVAPGQLTPVPEVVFEEPGWLVFGPAFADGGAGRIVVQGLGETSDPTFDPELLDFRVGGRRMPSGIASGHLHFAGGGADPPRRALPPGRYRITATRGPEWDAGQVEVEVEAGGEHFVEPFALRRLIELRGIVSADLHVHAEASDDTQMPNALRLASFLAEGVDVMVSTDHNQRADFGPALAALGARDRIHVVHGVEVTSSSPSHEAPWSLGHHNAWPLPLRPLQHRRGAPPSQRLSLPDLYASLRRDSGVRVVQLNHPRSRVPGRAEEGELFTHLARAGESFRPEEPLEAWPNRLLLEPGADGRTRGLDFDAIELANGKSWEAYLQVRRDWHSLLRQGIRRTGTANSDTHGPASPAGYPRNYVYLGPEGFEGRRFDEAIREGRLFGSTGPLIAAFQVNGARMGDRVSAGSGRVRVEIAVAAAPWVPVDEVRLLVNGELFRRFSPLPAGGAVMRLQHTEELALDADAFLTVEAGAPLDADPIEWRQSHPGPYSDAIAPGFVPLAFSNPIWVDADGDGRFDPPGLPAPSQSRLGWLLPPLALAVAWLFWRGFRAARR